MLALLTGHRDDGPCAVAARLWRAARWSRKARRTLCRYANSASSVTRLASV